MQAGRLVNLPQVGREDVQFAAILGHRAPSDLDPFLTEHLHYFLVGSPVQRAPQSVELARAHWCADPTSTASASFPGALT